MLIYVFLKGEAIVNICAEAFKLVNNSNSIPTNKNINSKKMVLSITKQRILF